MFEFDLFEKYQCWRVLTEYLESSTMKFIKFFLMYITSIICVVMIPAAFNISFGFHKVYKRIITFIFDFVQEKSAPRKCSCGDENEELIPEENYMLEFDYRKHFELDDVSKFASAGIKAIVDDSVTKRFTAEELSNWNLMNRSYGTNHYMSFTLGFIWFLGTIFRYLILFPLRLTLIALTSAFLVIIVLGTHLIPTQFFRRKYNKIVNIAFCRLTMASLGIFPSYYDEQYRPKSGVVVANHTTPLDVIILGGVCHYRYMAQIQPGYFSFFQSQLTHLGHIFFERTDICDRSAVAECIKQHASCTELPPIIVFPEGTCINNTSVMLFRKGAFEVSEVVYPVAIKYNPIFGDPFWNSSTTPYGWYLIYLISSWFIHCDVWYLPPIKKLPNENSIAFASRVQKAIAEKARIINLGWDGNLKRSFVPPYLKYNKQKEYARSLIVEEEAPPKGFFSSSTTDMINFMSNISSQEALLFEGDDSVFART